MAARTALILADVATFFIALLGTGSVVYWLGQQHVYGAHTHAQIGLAIALTVGFAGAVTVEVEAWLAVKLLKPDYAPVSSIELPATTVGHASEQPDAEAAVKRPGHNGDATPKPHPEAVQRLPLAGSRTTLCAVGQLALIIGFLYLCDRTDIFAKGKKVYNPSAFWGIWALICLAALASTRRLESTKVMQREQTDEWKGWMQIMFLMYHYFAEHEVYNAIRVYIAAYVWMTGYGNYCLYLKGKAFTTRRTLQMIIRLNLLGAVVCMALNNEFMLYYICAMHTFFTVVVALAMYVKYEQNSCPKVMCIKIAATFLFTLVIYDGPRAIFTGIFGVIPGVRQLFAFHDPVHPEFTDEMHEWHFRSGLDRFIWIFGMICAFQVNRFERLIEDIDGLSSFAARQLARLAVAAAALLVGFAWWYFVFTKEKYSYNAVHPFTSFIPISVFLLLRNLFPPLRQRYMYLFAFLGKTTLETYIFQFHIWMKTTGVNGSPKSLMVWIPGWYYLNLVLTTLVYMFLSFRMFHITDDLKNVLTPDDLQLSAKRIGGTAAFLLLCYGASFAVVGDADL